MKPNQAEWQAFLEALRNAPERPGCYLFLDGVGKVLYVGKANNLRNRVQTYRRQGADGRLRFVELFRRAKSVEFRVTDHEIEAVLLEDQLVKRHQPPLNVLLKDDKAFLLIHLDTDHPWPRLGLARRRRGPGEFFGPFGSAWAARRSKKLLMKVFGLRDCSDHTLANRRRPCLKYDIGLCSAPCVGKVEAHQYERALQQARSVLKGEVKALIQEQKHKMEKASAAMEYESAMRARDRMQALQALAAPQKVRLQRNADFDVLGIDERGHFALLEYREGEWVHTRQGQLPWVEEPGAMVGQLLPALYRVAGAEIPPEILVAALPEEGPSLQRWFSELSGRKVEILAPARGERRALVRMAESNARAQKGARPGGPWLVTAERLASLLQASPPAVVDCIDVSHFQGQERVAAKVRFVEGRPDRDQYRRYLVAGGVGNDDFEAMDQVLRRVVRRSREEGLADLVILDGGRLQLDAGLQAVRDMKADLPLAALAKARKGRGPVAAEERLFVPGRSQAVILERGSPERLFLERIRDEAHRFAVSYHRRKRENLRLVLEQVPGVGPKRRKLLLKTYASLAAIRDADRHELAALPSMNWELAEAVQEHLLRVLP